ncbi:MAG: hypothetical protein QM831_34045 [Kofleriaceae bacterium]
MFAAFYRDAIDKDVIVRPVGMVHRDGNPFEGIPLDADDHACVDFRFCADPKMRWWFDHHPTAFQPPGLRDIFEREHAPTWFFDPKAPSCAGFMAKTLAHSWNWTPPKHLQDAVQWADKIDAAKFNTAAEAISLELPAQRIAAWLANGRTGMDTARYVEWLSSESLDHVAHRPEMVAQIAALETERAKDIDAIRAIAKWHDDIVVFDRFDDLGARNPGFLGYWLFPESLYAVAGTRTQQTIKITVGWNKWTTSPRKPTVDVGALCARFGGGGHAKVGGITLRGDELERARTTVQQLVKELVRP